MLTFHYEKKNIYQFNHGASLQNQLLTKYPQSHLKSLCSSIKCTRIHLSCRSNILSALDMSCSIAQRNADRQWQHPSVGAWPGHSHTHQAAPSCPGSSAASFILRPMTCKKKQCVFSPLFLRRGKDFLHTPSCKQAGEPPTTQSPRNYSLNYSPDQEASKIPSHVKTTYLHTPHSCPSLQVVGEATSCTCRGGYECKLNSFSLAKYHHQPASHSPGHWS